MQSEKPIAYHFGKFVFDIDSLKLIEIEKDETKEVNLTRQLFNFLLLLLENNNKVVRKETIFEIIWSGERSVADGRLNTLVNNLRIALDDNKKEIIVNKPAIGYKFGIDFAKIFTKEELQTLLQEVSENTDDEIKSSITETNEKNDRSKESETSSESEKSQQIFSEKREIPSGNSTGRFEDSKSIKAVVHPLGTFEMWLKNSKLKWWFRLTVALTIVFSIVFSVLGWDIKAAIRTGSLSNVLLVIISLIYYWKYSLYRLKNFRPFSEDTTSDMLKDEVKQATKCKDKLDWETTRDNAKDGSGIFRFCWQVLLLVWIFMYVLLAFKTETNYFLGASITGFNNLNTLLLIICFYTFNTLEKGFEEFKENSFWLFALFFIVVLSMVEFGLLYYSSEILKLMNLSPDTNIKGEISWFFRVISGIGGAIALALFVGRLQSKFFNAATRFVVIFFSYIAIQPLFVFFEDNSIKMQFVTAIVVHIAVALKYFLFLYLFWAFESGRLLFYLVRVRQANKEVEDEWQKFQIVFEKHSSSKNLPR